LKIRFFFMCFRIGLLLSESDETRQTRTPMCKRVTSLERRADSEWERRSCNRDKKRCQERKDVRTSLERRASGWVEMIAEPATVVRQLSTNGPLAVTLFVFDVEKNQYFGLAKRTVPL